MIGIFDSGIGGLTVVKAVLKVLPEYQLLYLGDTARTPYGNRSQELIYQFTLQAVEYLFKRGCGIVIIACNTASAEALRHLQQDWLPKNYPERRILGVIRPVVEAAAKASVHGRVGVIGTRGTVISGAYQRELINQRPELVVFQQACPLLVPIVEEGWQDRPETNKIIRHYLKPLKAQRIDTLILGCTHYPILGRTIARVAGRRVKVLDSGQIVADKLADYLLRHPEIDQLLTRGQKHQFLVTDLTPQFIANAEKWLGRKINLEKISLE